MKTGTLVLSSLVVLLGVSGCGSMVRSRDPDSLGKIRSAALVAVTVTEPSSAHIGLNLNSGKVGATAGGSEIPMNDENVDKMFADLNKQFGEQMKWKMMATSTMAAKAGYRKAYDSTMKGFQNKMPPGQGMRQFNVKDVMDFDSPRILDVSGRDELIRALGVDAIIVARIDVELNGTTVMGIGSRHPQSNLAFMVYTVGREKPTWFEGKLEGEESKESVGKTGFIDEELLSKLALQSVQTAYRKIGSSSNE